MRWNLRALTGLAALLAAGAALLPSAGAAAAPAPSTPPARPADAAPWPKAAPARAAATPLPIKTFSDIEVGSRYTFISGGKASPGIVVTDLAGRAVSTIPTSVGAAGLALSRDGRTLYAALTEAGAVAAFDTRTLRERARYNTRSCPVHLAVTDRIWFGFKCDDGFENGGIGSIDLRVTPPAVKLAEQRYYYAPILAAARTGKVLVAGETGLSPATVVSYAVTADGGLTRLGEARETVGSNLGDVAVTPDGSTVYTAAGAPYEIHAFATSDMTPRGQLETTAYPNAVAVSPRGDRLAGGSNAYYDPDVFVFRTSDGTRQAPIEIGERLNLATRGLAWGRDGRTLFAVSTPYQEPPALHVLPVPAAPSEPAPPSDGRLPLPAFTDIEVSGRYAFISGGGRANEIVVTDLDGRLVRRIPGQAGALSLALSRDGATLYAVLKSTATVSAIDTRTLRERARYVTRTCPSSVAVTDRVWFGYACGFGWDGGIGRIDVGSAQPAVTLGLQPADYYAAPDVYTPRNANLVVAADGSTTSQQLDVYEQAADASLTKKVSGELAANQLALSPDGSTLYSTRGGLKAYAVSDLSLRRAFSSDGGAALGLSADGARIGHGIATDDASRVAVFSTADGARQATLPITSAEPVSGLAFSADGKRVFAVTLSRDWTNPVPALHVLAA